MPYFSIVVPVYNVEKYIDPCIDSLLNQSFSDFEVILIDDGSTDSSLDILNKRADLDARLKVFTQKNQGLSQTRNRGVSYAMGEYLLFLDSDDLYSPQALEIIYSHCQKSSVDILMFGVKAFTESQNSLEAVESMYQRNGDILDHMRSGCEYFTISVAKDMFYPSACLYALRLGIARGLKFYPGIYHEDNLYTAQLLFSEQCKSTYVIADALYLRRIREGSITTASASMKHAEGYLTVYKELVSMFKKLSINDLDTQSSIDRYLRTLFACAVDKAYLANNRSLPLGVKKSYIKEMATHKKNLLSIKSWFSVLFPKLFFLLKRVKRA